MRDLNHELIISRLHNNFRPLIVEVVVTNRHMSYDICRGVIPYRREPYRRVPLGRVHLDERRLDEVQ